MKFDYFIDIDGIDETIRKKLDSEKVIKKVDELTEGSIRRIGTHAANMAPVKTGHLRNQLTEQIRSRSQGKSIAWVILEGTDYTMIQELTHRFQSRFAYKAVKAETPRYLSIIKENLREGW